ncbi:uncharacterized protein N7459_008275 [Penicillium hispanicum]|uniref:uncharacterized protein n=1 Tax=Penicillium hispanicum TaxID=1080232 RepID=UPI00253F8914|nr:uncharacterized protein N7459_008275 [Penicillium hispanicum]KAJ5573848.1 hypothetical protein N7459_008275 [Penicillium hispanicum]
MLATLPSELLDLIIGQIASRRDLKRLCEVCTRLYDLTIPHLYRSLILCAPEFSLEHLVTDLATIPLKHLKYAEELGFSVPIHNRVESRCVHHCGNDLFDEVFQDEFTGPLANDDNMDLGDTYESTDKDLMVGPLFDLSRALDPLRLSDDQLRSFRWEVGTCVPKALFHGNRSFLGNQRRLQSITIITDGECGANKNYSANLVQFRELLSLDWRGLNQFHDFESVSECIKAHGHQIQSLTLDLLAWARAEKIWADGYRQRTPQPARIPDNFFSQRVLDIHPQDHKVIFLSLESLHLSAVSFSHTAMEMAYAFNIERLRSLKLRNCPGSLDWLQVILNSGKSMELKTFELALDLNSLPRDAYLHITETISNFIQLISGLESLYLMLPAPIDWTTLTDNLSTHHHHLKRFVMHHLVDRGGQDFIDGQSLAKATAKAVMQIDTC